MFRPTNVPAAKDAQSEPDVDTNVTKDDLKAESASLGHRMLARDSKKLSPVQEYPPRRHAEELIRSRSSARQRRGRHGTRREGRSGTRPRGSGWKKLRKIPDEHVYELLNKPPEIVSTLSDPEGLTTIRNLMFGVSQRVFPVGRLDYAASGAVFLTNDGELASRMLMASPFLAQAYWIKVKGRLNEDQLKSLAGVFHGTIRPLRVGARGRQESRESVVRSGNCECRAARLIE